MTPISKIRLKNFKSFKHANIPIPQGFTAIVGPNGSGKSNIVDAICFVLGRNSAKSLRAERFSDLIFNGGKKEKAAGHAEVSLYLDNSNSDIDFDAKELEITRRINNSGGSIYRLNGKRTTRTRILEILSAANINPDGHNIILQGDITSIIEMTPVQRRGIIDEIAGIAKYDEKKKKSTRELEKVSENVSTVAAVISEVRTNLDKLEIEKNNAIQHNELKSKIKKNRGIILTSHNLFLKNDIERKRVKINHKEKKSAQKNKHLNILQIKRDVKKKQLDNINSGIILKEETESFELFREVEKNKNLLESIRNQIKNYEKQRGSIEEKIKKKHLEISDISKKINDYKFLNKKLNTNLILIEKGISNRKKILDKKYVSLTPEDEVFREKRGRLIDVKTILEQEQNNFLEVEKKKALFNERIASIDIENKKLKQDIDILKQELKITVKNKNTCIIQKHAIESKQNRDYHRKKDLITKQLEVENNLDKISILLDKKLGEIAHLEAKYDVIEEAAKVRTTNKAAEFILKLRDKGDLKGVHGTISELGIITPQYSKALETALGKSLSFIVVDNENVAEKCILHLKKEHIGWATFLPLNRLKTIPPTKDELKISKSNKGFAIDLIRFEKKFGKSFETVFKNTIIVDSLATAKLDIGNARMATIDGDLIEPSYMISGGHYKSSKEALEELDKYKQKLDSVNNEIKKINKDKIGLTERMEKTQKTLKDLRSSELDFTKKREALVERLRTLNINIKMLRKSIDKNGIVLREKNLKLKNLKKDASLIQKSTLIISTLIDKIQSEKDGIENELSMTQAGDLVTEIKSLERKVSILNDKHDNFLNQIHINNSKVDEILAPRIIELERSLKTITEKSNSTNNNIETIRKKKNDLEIHRSDLEKKVNDISTKIKKTKNTRENCNKGIEKITDKIKSLRQICEDLSHSLERLRIDKARSKIKLEEIQKNLEDFYDIEIEIIEPINTLELERETSKMEAKIKSLEPINMRAIEDFEELKEKFDKLDSRVKILLSEKEAIIELMDEIELRKKSVFMDVFDGIVINFIRIFERLSKGGTADLILDEDNPLDGGLQIRAHPAGKNPRYIELMSGGEKTLTALSLIFAIQRYQPAPFYILDEIDMFLDDDNVRKVSELIKESSSGDQFIVVSLKSSLMSSAGQLFGISNENGVSKIIGVELEEIAT